MPTRRTVTRRRNSRSVTASAALINAEILLTKAGEYAREAAEEAMRAVAVFDKEPMHSFVKQSENFTISHLFDDVYRIYESAMTAGTYAEEGARAAGRKAPYVANAEEEVAELRANPRRRRAVRRR